MNSEQIKNLFGEAPQSTLVEKLSIWKTELPWRKYAQQVALEVLFTLEAKGLSQKGFAQMAGVSPQMVNKWLKGDTNFTFETVSKIEATLGISLVNIKSQSPQKKTEESERFKIPMQRYQSILPIHKIETFNRRSKIIEMHSPFYSSKTGS